MSLGVKQTYAAAFASLQPPAKADLAFGAMLRRQLAGGIDGKL